MIVSALAVAILLGACIFLGMPRARAWQRAASAAAFVALIGVVYGGSIDLLGRPKPLRLEWRTAAEAKVLAATMREGEAIYVWLETGKGAEPRSYILPWNMGMAQQIQDAMAEGERKGADVKMAIPHAAGAEMGAPKFYALPQPAPPPKNYGAGGAMVVRHPGL
jgi:hypothetical protein